MKTLRLYSVLFFAFIVLFASGAHAICVGSGEIVATPNNTPGAPAWTYTLNIIGDSLGQVSIAWALPVDQQFGSCSCSDIMSDITIPDVAGYTEGAPDGCPVSFTALLDCDGDALFSHSGILLVYTADLDAGCTPEVPVVTLYFQSDQPPVPMDVEHAYIGLLDDALGSCWLPLTGVFPALACDPVAADGRSWGQIKSMFH